jgi:hypothetical protein
MSTRSACRPARWSRPTAGWCRQAGGRGSGFGFKVAQARPDKVKALVAVEPAGIGDPAKAAALKNIPTVMIFGDYIEQDARWPQIRKND